MALELLRQISPSRSSYDETKNKWKIWCHKRAIEKQSVPLAAEGRTALGLKSFAGNGLDSEGDIHPSLLADDLVQNKKRGSKVVKVEVGIGSGPRSKHRPVIIERSAIVLSKTVGQAHNALGTVIARNQLAVEQVDPVEGKRNQQGNGNESSADDLGAANNQEGMERLSGAVANIEQAESVTLEQQESVWSGWYGCSPKEVRCGFRFVW